MNDAAVMSNGGGDANGRGSDQAIRQ
jgi:hypothetical protein